MAQTSDIHQKFWLKTLDLDQNCDITQASTPPPAERVAGLVQQYRMLVAYLQEGAAAILINTCQAPSRLRVLTVGLGPVTMSPNAGQY